MTVFRQTTPLLHSKAEIEHPTFFLTATRSSLAIIHSARACCAALQLDNGGLSNGPASFGCTSERQLETGVVAAEECQLCRRFLEWDACRYRTSQCGRGSSNSVARPRRTAQRRGEAQICQGYAHGLQTCFWYGLTRSRQARSWVKVPTPMSISATYATIRRSLSPSRRSRFRRSTQRAWPQTPYEK